MDEPEPDVVQATAPADCSAAKPDKSGNRRELHLGDQAARRQVINSNLAATSESTHWSIKKQRA